MKKRLFSLFLSLVIVLAYCSCALAMQDSEEPRNSAVVLGHRACLLLLCACYAG